MMPITTSPGALLILLLAGHFLADFPLQGEFLALGKNRNTDIGRQWWPWALPGHAMIHAGFVLVITGSALFALLEFVLHTLIDWAKCEDVIGMHADQAFHVLCKFGWWIGVLAAIALGAQA
jgi:hypothetical protein